MSDDPTYSLICDNCGEIFLSQEAFPSPQLCPKCKTVPSDKDLLLAEEVRPELARVLHKAIRQFETEDCPTMFDLHPHIDQLFRCLNEALAKAKPIYEREKQEAVKAERERIIIYLTSNGRRTAPLYEGASTEFRLDWELWQALKGE